MQHDAKNPKYFHPVGYASWALMDQETRYTITELDGLAVVYGLQYYKYLIHGCDITVVMDHQTLKHLMDRKEPWSNQMFRWRLEIADFEVLGGQLKFEYKKGSEHKVADSLSRNPVDPPDSAKELEDKWVVSSAVEDPPELSRMEEHRWVAARALVNHQAV